MAATATTINNEVLWMEWRLFSETVCMKLLPEGFNSVPVALKAIAWQTVRNEIEAMTTAEVIAAQRSIERMCVLIAGWVQGAVAHYEGC